MEDKKIMTAVDTCNLESADGYHEDGIGYSPSGEWCGECLMNTCKGCLRAMSGNIATYSDTGR